MVRAAYPDQDANCHNLTGPGCLNTDVTGDGMTDTDFFLAAGVLHIAPPYGDTHRVYPHPVPEPSTVLGLIAVGLSSIVGFKGKKEPK
ncbi:PEP-CTERM sorting domain-containing protein [Microcystis sp. LE19-10.1B]|uniref:PEP-CTERM sorting domain-containing protein n=1 Tax=Microcystis sp. LE19-10.1B TaxID=3016428 RepID=UPI00258A794E|nr:PEP-CTERM sorting domain-containing protein [Microcystis sp. LE19-10.1B]